MIGAVGAAAAVRDPSAWLDDVTWHRRMFAQSQFRWVPEDPMSIALRWTRGRLEYDSPRDLSFLDDRLHSLRDYTAGIDDSMLAPLADAQRRCAPRQWADGLQLVGLTDRDVQGLRHAAPGVVKPHPQASRALRGIPLRNPFTDVWELRQIRGMYTAAEDLIEDTFCDLATELAPTLGWTLLAGMTRYHRSARTLQRRVEAQRLVRGEPGDPRRVPQQRY